MKARRARGVSRARWEEREVTSAGLPAVVAEDRFRKSSGNRVFD